MNRETIGLGVDQARESVVQREIRGYIEKIEVVPSEKTKNGMAELVISTSEGEEVLKLQGITEEKVYYPRTETHNKIGAVNTYDGSNPIMTRIYAHEHIKIFFRADAPESGVDVSVYFSFD